uniref:Uncharacterized protein n=1 Tax=Oryza meridionalis TaxID=40149 RepID=A0A0E0EI84_9ORYZ
MSVFRRPFRRPVNRRLAFNPVNPATPIDQHFVSSSDGPTVPVVQSLPAVHGKVNARHCDVRIARNNGMSTTIGASPSSRIAQNDTSLHGVNTCQRSRVGQSRADGVFPYYYQLIVMLLDIQA